MTTKCLDTVHGQIKHIDIGNIIHIIALYSQCHRSGLENNYKENLEKGRHWITLIYFETWHTGNWKNKNE